MSVGAATIRLARPGRRLLSQVRTASLPVRAFLVSRLLVLLAGGIGVLTLSQHAPAGEAEASLHRLGPVGSVLAGSVDRFDATYYLAIAQHGYGSVGSVRLAFFPLYPLLIRVGSVLTGSPVLAGFLISAGAFLGALVLVHELTELELGRRAADATVLLLAFAPLSFFFTAIYTESLFLLLSVASVLAARREHWRLACGLGALATLTRPTGIALAVALVAIRWRSRGGPDRSLAWVLALPGAVAGYLSVLVAQGYPLLAPFSAQAGWHRLTTIPLVGLAGGVWAAFRGAMRIAGGGTIYHPTLDSPFSAGAESLILFGVLTLMLLAVRSARRRLPPAYALYAGAVILLCLSSPQVAQPLWSIDRFALTLFPVWMAAGAWVAERRLEKPAIVLGSILLVFYALQFSSWSFVA